jgi:cell division protein FtsQ
VRRVWPNSLSINIVEQQALARWSAGGLVNNNGEWFKPEEHTYPTGLPVFSGAENMQAEISDYYMDSSALLKPLELGIVQVEANQRRALNLYLDNGIKLVLGRDQQLERLQRFIKVYPKLFASRINEIAKVDLRYSNGMSVTWREKQDGAK